MKREKFLRKTIVVFLTVMMLGTLVLPSQVNAAQIMNWSKMDGVIATSDCHDGALTPDKVIDGDIAERTSRWSSKNIWDTDDPNEANHETSHGHWIQLELPNEAKIHSVKIYWEQKMQRFMLLNLQWMEKIGILLKNLMKFLVIVFKQLNLMKL